MLFTGTQPEFLPQKYEGHKGGNYWAKAAAQGLGPRKRYHVAAKEGGSRMNRETPVLPVERILC
jgi:hypothetical protein